MVRASKRKRKQRSKGMSLNSMPDEQINSDKKTAWTSSLQRTNEPRHQRILCNRLKVVKMESRGGGEGANFRVTVTPFIWPINQIDKQINSSLVAVRVKLRTTFYTNFRLAYDYTTTNHHRPSIPRQNGEKCVQSSRILSRSSRCRTQ